MCTNQRRIPEIPLIGTALERLYRLCNHDAEQTALVLERLLRATTFGQVQKVLLELEKEES